MILRKIVTLAVIIFSIFITLYTSPVLADINQNLDPSLDKNLVNGAKLFQANCAGCHVKGGNIVRRGKNLKSKALHKNKVDTQDAIASLVTNGKGIMSAYGDKLTPEEIANVSGYVLQRATENWQ